MSAAITNIHGCRSNFSLCLLAEHLRRIAIQFFGSSGDDLDSRLFCLIGYDKRVKMPEGIPIVDCRKNSPAREDNFKFIKSIQRQIYDRRAGKASAEVL